MQTTNNDSDDQDGVLDGSDDVGRRVLVVGVAGIVSIALVLAWVAASHLW